MEKRYQDLNLKTPGWIAVRQVASLTRLLGFPFFKVNAHMAYASWKTTKGIVDDGVGYGAVVAKVDIFLAITVAMLGS